MTRPTETGQPYIPSGKFATKAELEERCAALTQRLAKVEAKFAADLAAVRAELDEACAALQALDDVAVKRPVKR